ncbi:hypothetical protein FACS189421_08720 [Bacteroidia bacterium]|nr:hypothetical protein FACS189421_08720 [Bacteroidia bacterium]GHT48818.1 hypothetical protein FACS189440_13300 [Bacteroidia bacterium]
MATYDNLPVYKQTYDLLLQLFRVCQNMERDFKFTLGENIKKEIIELIINVYRANCRDNMEKLPLLRCAQENVEVVRLLLRLLNDLKQIGLKEFIAANEKIESVSKQMSAWAYSLSRGTANREVKKGSEGQSPEGLFTFQESAG